MTRTVANSFMRSSSGPGEPRTTIDSSTPAIENVESDRLRRCSAAPELRGVIKKKNQDRTGHAIFQVNR